MRSEKAKKAILKKARKGFRGYPVATIAFYGPTDRTATKLVVSIVAYKGAEPNPMRKWFSDTDIRHDLAVLQEVLQFIRINTVTSIAMTEQIIGCPHEEGIDYPEGESCPKCPFWQDRDRWANVHGH